MKNQNAVSSEVDGAPLAPDAPGGGSVPPLVGVEHAAGAAAPAPAIQADVPTADGVGSAVASEVAVAAAARPIVAFPEWVMEYPEAVRAAMFAAFGDNDDDDDDDEDGAGEHRTDCETELSDTCWDHYPGEDRSLLRSVGRPDYEHDRAPAFNLAIVAVASVLRERGLADQAALLGLRRALWPLFFAAEPYRSP